MSVYPDQSTEPSSATSNSATPVTVSTVPRAISPHSGQNSGSKRIAGMALRRELEQPAEAGGGLELRGRRELLESRGEDVVEMPGRQVALVRPVAGDHCRDYAGRDDVLGD